MCACFCPRETHEHYHAGDYCGRCPCPRYRPLRVRWWQFWRPRPALTLSDLRLMYQLPEEIR